MSRSALLLLLLLAAPPASAHEFAPSYLQLVEHEDSVSVLFRRSLRVAEGGSLHPVLPCAGSAPRVRVEGVARVARWRLDCETSSLVGSKIAVSGLEATGTDALVHVALRDGREIRHVLTPSAPSFLVPPRERTSVVFTRYVGLGMSHLFAGLDHLLFISGLVWLLGRRRLFRAITAFTLGHSATLALASVGWVETSSALVEIAIAASLVLVALEIARPGSSHWAVRRNPALLPLAFGLLHGLGFAGALTEVGLPASAIPLALLSFNLGIEIGQLLVAVMVLLVLLWFQGQRLYELPATVIGGFGVYLVLQRADAWLGF